MKKNEEKIQEIIAMLDFLIEDLSIPKNVRKAIEKAKLQLLSDQDLVVRATSAIYAIEEIADDTNMPIHARTHVWKIISSLESLKE